MSIDNDEDHIFTLSEWTMKQERIFKETHPEGTIITYECSGFTNKGVPRFARYVRIRDDIIIKEHNTDNDKNDNLNKVKDIFSFMETYYKKNYDTFRAKSYSKINKLLKELKSDNDLLPEKLSSIKGIGKNTIDRILEIINTGTLREYEKLKNKKITL